VTALTKTVVVSKDGKLVAQAHSDARHCCRPGLLHTDEILARHSVTKTCFQFKGYPACGRGRVIVGYVRRMTELSY